LAKIIDYYQPKILVVLGEKELKSKNIVLRDCRKRQDFLVEREKIIE
jgi:histidyl-tRNA synthetase